MEHTPPPFFKRGPTPFVRLLVFSALSAALILADAQLAYLNPLRQLVAAAIYPLQRLAGAPLELAGRVGEFFVTQASLRADNARLSQQNLANAALLQKYEALAAENGHLRSLLAARERREAPSILSEILYAGRDPFSRKVVIDRGANADVRRGSPVVDAAGVVGQITRVYPWVSEVTLITDKGQIVPVQNLRNGLRAVLAGTGNDGLLELKFIPLNADFQNGDKLVTSGIDGVYPPGLAVAEVVNVERNAAELFARITCRPMAGVTSHRQVLVLDWKEDLPEPPPPESEPARRSKGRRGG